VALGGTVDGEIGDTVRAHGPDALSLVAVEEGRVVGHMLFSRVDLAGMAGPEATGFGPMAVAAERRPRGIGGAGRSGKVAGVARYRNEFDVGVPGIAEGRDRAGRSQGSACVAQHRPNGGESGASRG
jgi:hypothetical protein